MISERSTLDEKFPRDSVARASEIVGGLCILLFALAEPATAQTFVAPTGKNHFALPAGTGQLKVCRSPDNEHREGFVLSAGTEFVDSGKIGPYKTTSPGWWLLQVRTRQNVTFKRGQDCATVAAAVVPTEIPYNYRAMKSLTRFRLADNRYFEVLAPNNRPFEILAMIYLSATAVTDFADSAPPATAKRNTPPSSKLSEPKPLSVVPELKMPSPTR